MIETLARNWWLLVVRGVLGLIIGVIAFTMPGVTLAALVMLYGVYALVDGAFALGALFSGGMSTRSRWALLLEAIVGIGAGIVTFLWPPVTLLVLIYMVAFWAIMTGVFEIAAAIQLRRNVPGEIFLVLAGIVSILFGVVILMQPLAGEVAIAYMIGFYAFLFGVLFIGLGLRLRKMAPASAAPAV